MSAAPSGRNPVWAAKNRMSATPIPGPQSKPGSAGLRAEGVALIRFLAVAAQRGLGLSGG
jgi:hypothetical protein